MKKSVILLAAGALMLTAGACSSKKQQQEEVTQATTVAEPVHATLHVGGACEMCTGRIETAAKSVEGVVEAKWDLETKELKLDYDAGKTSLENISKAIAKVGHDTGKDTASDDVYNSLPPCCKYRG